jgi:drug/metabolite transporter (DMT)-like permease
VVSTVAAMLAFFAGLRRTSPSTAAILSTFEPVVTAGLAALAFGESLTPVQFAGGLLVLSSAVVLQLRPGPLRPVTAETARNDAGTHFGSVSSAIAGTEKTVS